jgi:Protein of unknown function (DUF4230)
MKVMWNKIFKTPLLYALILITAAVLFFFLSLEYRDRKLELYSDRIRNLEEMVTARHIYRNVIYTEIKENLIVDKRSLFTIDYIVTAGVDFSGGVKIDTESSTVRITYPYPKILSVDADESTIDEYFSRQRFGKLKQSDYLNLLYDEKSRIEEDALNAGILERADKNLQRLISGILKEGGIEKIRFEYIKGEVGREES